MKKITTTLNLIAIRGNVNYSRVVIKQFREYLKNGVDCVDVIDIHTKELERWEKVLNEYRQNITFLKATKSVFYKKLGGN
ncbi:hypothetical protein [Staphylococcus felis]|uniref:hypothetical protein n=1 Tax=Staphylococcus felis TaxID=46127 RepID=UPI000CD2BD20|nr:hypothetical protein [Staphylococcus felis]AVP37436.1 hypothetical protein C7J90_10885 [Staphylococcus felis]PNZ37114.1 hypothetical protein CD143_02620 [Staphylococcus felis]QQB02616.1 hypothetical protein I6H71_07620 [Staphylococcus felis]